MKTLSDRQLDVARLVAEGLRNKDIAERLGLAEDTVKKYVSTAYDRVGTETRVGLANWYHAHKEEDVRSNLTSA